MCPMQTAVYFFLSVSLWLVTEHRHFSSAMFKWTEDEVTAVYFWRTTWVGKEETSLQMSQHTHRHAHTYWNMQLKYER